MLIEELPSFILSERIGLTLCGKIDWLEYIEETDSVRIIDFKTGKRDEKPGSLQLPIYLLIARHCKSRPVTAAAYWYLDRDESPTPVELPDYDEAMRHVLEIGESSIWARRENHFPCAEQTGCRACLPYEDIVNGEAEHVYTDFKMRKEMYATAI